LQANAADGFDLQQINLKPQVRDSLPSAVDICWFCGSDPSTLFQRRKENLFSSAGGKQLWRDAAFPAQTVDQGDHVF
jgi:hypothetical protein